MEDIIKLIDLSLEDGRLSQDDYKIILKKAESMGISEEEFNLILSKRVKQFEPRADFDTQKSGSKLPYIFAAFAVAFTFVDWIGFYSRSSVMGTSASWDTSFSGWWGGYGATVVMIYAVGCYFYSKGYNLYWLAGLLAIADALYIYYAIANADVSVSYNYEGYGSTSEAGYELLWGFWAFVIASALFALSAPFIGNRSTTKRRIESRFKQNFKAGWATLGITAIINTIVYTIIISSDESFGMALIIAILISIILSMITLLIYIFSPSVRSTGYIILGLALISSIALYYTAGERAEFLKMLYTLIPYPICYIILERSFHTEALFRLQLGA
ncbi:MAG: hypothetical protein IPJ06_15010 [Saprospiraceae bacterium]|nr:hypothetical protein [Saprospiraceae bacterium]